MPNPSPLQPSDTPAVQRALDAVRAYGFAMRAWGISESLSDRLICERAWLTARRAVVECAEGAR